METELEEGRVSKNNNWDVRFEIKLNLKSLEARLAAIDGMTETLEDLPLPPVARARMERLNIIRAVRGTTGIEGNRMTEDEVASIVDGSGVASQNVDEQENINARDAMRFLKEQKTTKTPKVDEIFIKKAHAITTRNIRNDLNIPGEYRRDFVYAGIYEFPDPKAVPGLMKEFTAFINSKDCVTLHPIVRAVLGHFYFVSVHPFGDGNGRVARAVEAFLLYHGGYAAAGFYSLANFYYKNRKAYINALEDARLKYDGDLTKFVEFALDGFLIDLADLNAQGVPYLKVIKYSQYVDALVDLGEISQRLAAVLKAIANTEEGITPREFVAAIPDWAKKLYRGKGEWTLRGDLTLIRQSGLIKETDGRIYPNLSVIETQTQRRLS